MTSIEYPFNLPGKKWTAMTKEEQRQTYDLMLEMFKGLCTEIERDFDQLLEDGEAPLRTKVTIDLVFTDNTQDPRLP